MRSSVLDTNAYVAFKRGDDQVVAVIQRCPDMLICSTVLGELLAGFAAGTREARNREELSVFMQPARVRTVVCGEPPQITTRWYLPHCAAKEGQSPAMIYG